MIGPHEGKELELMLAGKKRLAVFHDVFITDLKNCEEIIPEVAFKPHVESGAIIRKSLDIRAAKDGTIITYVCFTPKGHEWRADVFFWIKQETIGNGRPSDHAFETMIGRLLDYEEYDILDFLQKL